MTDVKCGTAKAAGFGGVPACGNRGFALHLVTGSEPAV